MRRLVREGQRQRAATHRWTFYIYGMLYLVRVWLRYNYSVCVVVGVCVSGLTFVRFGELTVLEVSTEQHYNHEPVFAVRVVWRECAKRAQAAPQGRQERPADARGARGGVLPRGARPTRAARGRARGTWTAYVLRGAGWRGVVGVGCVPAGSPVCAPSWGRRGLYYPLSCTWLVLTWATCARARVARAFHSFLYDTVRADFPVFLGAG